MCLPLVQSTHSLLESNSSLLWSFPYGLQKIFVSLWVVKLNSFDNAWGSRKKESVREPTGCEIVPNTGANVTKLFTFATKSWNVSS